MNTSINAEGEELVLRNTNGDVVIIPKNRRDEALNHLQNNNYSAIDKIASELPFADDYAEEGSLIVKDTNQYFIGGLLGGDDEASEEAAQSSLALSQAEKELEELRKVEEKNKNLEEENEELNEQLGVEDSIDNYLSEETAVDKVSNLTTSLDKERVTPENVNNLNQDVGNLNQVSKDPYSGEEINVQQTVDLEKIQLEKSVAQNVDRLTANKNTILAEDGLTVSNDPPKEVPGSLSTGTKKQREKASQLTSEQIKQQPSFLDRVKNLAGFKKEPTDLKTSSRPEIVSEESMYPSMKEFGKEEVNIPDIPAISRKEMASLQEGWQEDINKWEASAEYTEEGDVDFTKSPFQPNLPASKQSPNFAASGCLGSGCRFTSQTLPFKSYYDIRSKAGVMGVTTGQEGKQNRDYSQIDSWDFAGTAEATGIGKNVFRPEQNFEQIQGKTVKEKKANYEKLMAPKREEFAKNFDSKVSPGTVFTAGYADEAGGYTNVGDKSVITLKGGKTLESKQEIRPRHSITAGPLDEHGDRWVWDVSGSYTVGNSGRAGVVTPKEFLKREKIMFATELTEHGSWSKEKLDKTRKHNRAMRSRVGK